MSILAGKKFFISDVDGTIFDRMPFYTEVFIKVCRKHGANPDNARRVYLETIGAPMPEQIKACLVSEELEFTEETIERGVAEFWAGAKKAPVVLFPGTLQTLFKLQEIGMTLFATSGSNGNELKELFVFHRLPPFAMILGSDETPKGTEHIRMFARKMNLSCEKFVALAVLVGDGPTDMRIAKEHGILGIGVTTTTTDTVLREAGATVTIPLLSEIFTI